MTPELIFGRGRGFDFHLQFSGTTWANLPSELETAMELLAAYREAVIALKLHLIKEPVLLAEIDGGL